MTIRLGTLFLFRYNLEWEDVFQTLMLELW